MWTRVVHLPSTPTYTIQGQKTDLYALDGISLGFNLNPKQIDTLFCLAYLMCHLCIKFISQKNCKWPLYVQLWALISTSSQVQMLNLFFHNLICPPSNSY